MFRKLDLSKVIVKHRNREGFQRLFLNQPIKRLRRHGINLQRAKQTRGGDRKAGLGCIHLIVVVNQNWTVN